MATSPEQAALTERIAEPGFTPSVKHLGGLLDLVSGSDEEIAKRAARAALRIESQYAARVAEQIASRARAAGRPGRGRLTALAGRLVEQARDPKAVTAARGWLLDALADADPKTRRAAARGLGKLEPSPALEAALAEAFDRAASEDDRKVLADALGRMGGEAARERLAGGEHVRASLIAEREAARRTPGRIDGSAAAPEALRVRFHARSGLETIVREELDGAFGDARVVGPGLVEATLEGPLQRALAIRTATHVAFPLESLGKGGDLAERVARSLTSAEAMAVFRAFTRVDDGAPIRFRLAFARSEHARDVAWRCAELVGKRSRAIVNDPRQSTWEVHIDDDAIELVPRGYTDERFAYRQDLVPASSHPTIAAALARAAPRREDDVVWDPFVGAGAELVERSRLGPYARLFGSDRDPRAILAARANLARAGVTAELEEADACAHAPEGVTLILTNPPMGRRVERGSHAALLEGFVAHAARILRPGGALAWLVPEPKKIRARAAEAGLVLAEGTAVDMGGFSAELSVYRKPPAR
jgi:23S rRNA G2445 N2-methylase RlmL